MCIKAWRLNSIASLPNPPGCLLFGEYNEMVFLVSSFLRKKWHPCVITLCSGLNEQFPHKSWVFDYLVSHWYSCVGRCGFAEGGMILGAQAASCMFPVNSLCFQTWDLSSNYLLPCLCSAIKNSNTLELYAELSAFFC